MKHPFNQDTTQTALHHIRGFSSCALLTLACATLACALSGCSGEDDSQDEQERTFEQQVTAGGELYGIHCSDCHGDAGQGTDGGPPVVGDDALPLEPPVSRMVRDSNFETSLDVFVFVSDTMPADAPGSLSDQQLVDILAFALFANGVELDEPLGFDNADDIVINSP